MTSAVRASKIFGNSASRHQSLPPADSAQEYPTDNPDSEHRISQLQQQARDQASKNTEASQQRLMMDQKARAAAAEELAKNYALKLDVVRQIENYEMARREFYDQKRQSNTMYWLAFTLVIKTSKLDNTRYLDFFSRKQAAENTYVRCILEMKEESEKLKHGSGHAAPRILLDDLLEVQERVAECAHGFGRTIETGIAPKLEEMVAQFNAGMDQIFREGEEYLMDVELAEGNVQQSYQEYRDQAEVAEKTGLVDQDLWIFEMRYRVAVGMLLESWQTSSKNLGDLFQRMKQTEMIRRQAINTALQTLQTQQINYWKSLPELGQTLSNLVQTRVADPQIIEKEIGADLRSGAQRVELSEEGKRRKAQIRANRPMGSFSNAGFPEPPASLSQKPEQDASVKVPSPMHGRETSPSATAVGEVGFLGGEGDISPPPAPMDGRSSKESKKRAAKEFNMTLAGPLQSPLTVLQRKSTNVFKGWKPVIAILTIDHYLHLFDIPATMTVSFTSAPEEAFDALIPRHDSLSKTLAGSMHLHAKEMVDNAKDMVAGLDAKEKQQRKVFAANVKDTCFEITENITTTGVKKVFKDTSHRKVTLKAASKDAMVEWCQLVETMSTATMHT